MKWKYFLRGLGVGILLTSLLLCFSYRTTSSGETDVVEQAKKLGMVFPKGTLEPPVASDVPVSSAASEPLPTQIPPNTNVSNGAGMTGNEAASQTQPEAQQPEAQQPEAKQPADQQAAQQPEAQQAAESTGKTDKKGAGKKYTVKAGSTSTMIAQEMKAAGVIDSVEAMDDYMTKSGLSRKIQPGDYTIPEGASYEEIARIITGQG